MCACGAGRIGPRVSPHTSLAIPISNREPHPPSWLLVNQYIIGGRTSYLVPGTTGVQSRRYTFIFRGTITSRSVHPRENQGSFFHTLLVQSNRTCQIDDADIRIPVPREHRRDGRPDVRSSASSVLSMHRLWIQINGYPSAAAAGHAPGIWHIPIFALKMLVEGIGVVVNNLLAVRHPPMRKNSVLAERPRTNGHWDAGNAENQLDQYLKRVLPFALISCQRCDVLLALLFDEIEGQRRGWLG